MSLLLFTLTLAAPADAPAPVDNSWLLILFVVGIVLIGASLRNAISHRRADRRNDGPVDSLLTSGEKRIRSLSLQHAQAAEHADIAEATARLEDLIDQADDRIARLARLVDRARIVEAESARS